MGKVAVFMTDEQWQAMKEFVRAYHRLHTDHMLLTGMLAFSQHTGKPPEDWLSQLKVLRELPGHRKSSQEIEELLAGVERERTDSRLTWLLNNLPKSGLIQ